MTEQERTELQQQFCIKTVQDMSEKDRLDFTFKVLMDSYTNNYTDEDFITEVQEYFPELITIDVKS